MGLKVIISAIALILSGCCTYQGKAVSKRTAKLMIEQGMDVQCP